MKNLLRVKLATKMHTSLKSISSSLRRFSEIRPRAQLPQSDADNSANSSVCPSTWRTTWHLAHEIDLTAQHYLSYFRLRGIFDKSLVMNVSESTALQRRNVSFLFLLIGGFIKPTEARCHITIVLFRLKRLYYREPFSIFSVLAERDWRFGVVQGDGKSFHQIFIKKAGLWSVPQGSCYC